MTVDEFIHKIEYGRDIMLKIGDRGFTILTWFEEGPGIAEWYKPETEKRFPNAQALVYGYLINGKPLAEYAADIVITDYTGNGRELLES